MVTTAGLASAATPTTVPDVVPATAVVTVADVFVVVAADVEPASRSRRLVAVEASPAERSDAARTIATGDRSAPPRLLAGGAGGATAGWDGRSSKETGSWGSGTGSMGLLRRASREARPGPPAGRRPRWEQSPPGLLSLWLRPPGLARHPGSSRILRPSHARRPGRASACGDLGGLSSIGRASDCGSEGYGFKPGRPPHLPARRPARSRAERQGRHRDCCRDCCSRAGREAARAAAPGRRVRCAAPRSIQPDPGGRGCRINGNPRGSRRSPAAACC